MHFRSLLPLLMSTLYATQAIAKGYGDCCLCHYIELQWLCVKWNENTDTLSCGLNGPFPPGSKCTVEKFYQPQDRLQANVSLYMGANKSPYRLDLGINPRNCKPWKEFPTQWTGWGAYMFNGGDISAQDMSVCERFGAA
ncbi:hypothetical protein KVR01_012730 [Diaporthe batatas]|uniref:uncharacterized protein n=1 Tax=Diaporthe batatas TaxID=748121 RepID=UPI001D056BAD|nr:uncharacterized protein KVR01_012730 [Diaporthe batatas]KAG8157346.1 hypothetical protein KVR01_012730 [Diaporthe batatas]